MQSLSSMRPCVGSGPGEGECSTFLGAGCRIWAEILGFALDEAIQMALTCKMPPALCPAPGHESGSNQAQIAAICEAFCAGKSFPAQRRSLTNSPSFVSDCNGQVLAPRI